MANEYLLANTTIGTNPYLLLSYLTKHINKDLTEKGKEGLDLVLPLTQGDRQYKIMEQRYPELLHNDTNTTVYFSEFLGEVAKKLLYTGPDFRSNLGQYIYYAKHMESLVRDYLRKGVHVVDINGNTKSLPFENGIELGRNELITYGSERAVSVLFGKRGEITRKLAGREGYGNMEDTLKQAADIFDEIHASRDVLLVQDPAIPGPSTQLSNEIYTPFHYQELSTNTDDIAKGIYVRITGRPEIPEVVREHIIAGLENYNGIIYCTEADTKFFPDGVVAQPSILTNPNIEAFVSQLGWGSMLDAMRTRTALIGTPFVVEDDPEKLFNQELLVSLDVSSPFSLNKNFSETLEEAIDKTKNIDPIMNRIERNYGTQEGLQYAAKVISTYLQSESIDTYKQVQPIFNVK